MNNKIKEGDIIVFDDKFYKCYISGIDEAVFNHIIIGVGSVCTRSPHCKGIIMPNDPSKFKYKFQNEQVKYIDGCNRFNIAARHPVVGCGRTFNVMLNLGKVKHLSNKLYEEYMAKHLGDMSFKDEKINKARLKIVKHIKNEL
jgi:hypothetical protein